jgi:hypothetical protein
VGVGVLVSSGTGVSAGKKDRSEAGNPQANDKKNKTNSAKVQRRFVIFR